MMTILLYELLADVAFSEMRGRWCQHVSVCVCVFVLDHD